MALGMAVLVAGARAIRSSAAPATPHGGGALLPARHPVRHAGGLAVVSWPLSISPSRATSPERRPSVAGCDVHPGCHPHRHGQRGRAAFSPPHRDLGVTKPCSSSSPACGSCSTSRTASIRPARSRPACCDASPRRDPRGRRRRIETPICSSRSRRSSRRGMLRRPPDRGRAGIPPAPPIAPRTLTVAFLGVGSGIVLALRGRSATEGPVLWISLLGAIVCCPGLAFLGDVAAPRSCISLPPLRLLPHARMPRRSSDRALRPRRVRVGWRSRPACSGGEGARGRGCPRVAPHGAVRVTWARSSWRVSCWCPREGAGSLSGRSRSSASRAALMANACAPVERARWTASPWPLRSRAGGGARVLRRHVRAVVAREKRRRARGDHGHGLHDREGDRRLRRMVVRTLANRSDNAPDAIRVFAGQRTPKGTWKRTGGHSRRGPSPFAGGEGRAADER